MPKEVYEDIDGDRHVTREWERVLVTMPVALQRGQFTKLDPSKTGKKFCEAHFVFRGIQHLESVPHDSDEDPCDKVKAWLESLENFEFSGERLSPIRVGKLISRED